MLSRGVLNGAAMNALTVNGDGIVHSAAGFAPVIMLGETETVRRATGNGSDTYDMIGSCSFNLRKTMSANSQVQYKGAVRSSVWLRGSADGIHQFQDVANSVVWKVGEGADVLNLIANTALATRVTIRTEDLLVLANDAFSTHRHGVHATSDFSLTGSAYANTYGSIKGTGYISLPQQSKAARIVTSQSEARIVMLHSTLATTWLTSSGDGTVVQHATIDAIRWLLGHSASPISFRGEIDATRVVAPAVVDRLHMFDAADFRRWGSIGAFGLFLQVDTSAATRRGQATATDQLDLLSNSDFTKRQQFQSASLYSLLGLMKLPHVHMRPIDDCRTFILSYEHRDFVVLNEPREMLAVTEIRDLHVPEENRDMSYHCCGDTK